MPTNLEIYQLLKREAAALEQMHADLQGYIACYHMAWEVSERLQSQCKVILARLDEVRAMLKRFKVLYRIKEQYLFYLGVDREKYGDLLFEKSSGANEYYCVVTNSKRPIFTIQGHIPEYFEPVIVEEP